ncbi:hypothetical protein PCZ31_1704 [Clostridioides difficile]|nr:hypothetical protein PCZ31_1704 [Clostridioides difficile]
MPRFDGELLSNKEKPVFKKMEQSYKMILQLQTIRH